MIIPAAHMYVYVYTYYVCVYESSSSSRLLNARVVPDAARLGCITTTSARIIGEDDWWLPVRCDERARDPERERYVCVHTCDGSPLRNASCVGGERGNKSSRVKVGIGSRKNDEEGIKIAVV